MSKAERDYQSGLIDRITDLLPGCLILKNDSGYLQGIPDLTVLWFGKWAFLEVKAHEGAAEQPNQDYYVTLANSMAFGAFIYPENEEVVLHDLQQALQPRRASLGA